MRLLPELAQSANPQAGVPRVGQISFLNTLPVVLPIERNHIALSVATVYGSPSQLNDSIQRGTLDLSAMSSFSFLKQGNLTLVPDLCIASRGAVGSVLFFSKVQPSLLASASVAITAASATSVNLLRIMLNCQYGVNPEFVVESNPDLSGDKYQAALVIGDMALAADRQWQGQYFRVDLGQWWYQHTSLPMVFGVWAARNEWISSFQAQFREISAALNNSLKAGLSELFGEVIQQAQSRSGLPAERLKRYYLEELDFRFTPEHHQGLRHYQSLCLQHGLL